MEFLGIGPLELLLILLLALIIFGPRDLEKMGHSFGRSLNKLVKSDTWRTVRQASEKMKTLPNDLMRQAEIEELNKSLHEPLEQPNQVIQPPSPEKKSEE